MGKTGSTSGVLEVLPGAEVLPVYRKYFLPPHLDRWRLPKQGKNGYGFRSCIGPQINTKGFVFAPSGRNRFFRTPCLITWWPTSVLNRPASSKRGGDAACPLGIILPYRFESFLKAILHKPPIWECFWAGQKVLLRVLGFSDLQEKV